MRAAALLAPLAIVLAACGGDPARLAVATETSTMTDRSAARSILVGEVTLPEYAEASQVVVQTPDGLIEAVEDVIWADTPSRAMTNSLVRNLSAITGAQVAAGPWPLMDLPDAELTVRVERMLLTADGTLRMSGQYAVRRDVGPGGEQLRGFDIAVPVADPGLGTLSAAHGMAWRLLAEEIAPTL